MIKSNKTCYQCKACINICPKHCINFINEEIRVNYDMCIGCNSCEQVCQLINSPKITLPKKVYAAVTKNNELYLNSSSGGVATLIMQIMIDKDFVIFAAKYDDDLSIVFDHINTKEDINYFMKSKYAFSDTKNTYSKIKEFLNRGEKILFIGLPCQIAGLKLYLKVEFKNLYTVDLLCHGAPSNYLFKNHIKYLEEKYSKNITSYEFREKSTDNYGNYFFTIKFSDNTKKIGPAILDPYYKNFIDGNIMRYCCYRCEYSTDKRIGDLSLGDFWYIKNYSNCFDKYDAISSVLVNTVNGDYLWNNISEKLFYKEYPMEVLKKSTNAVVCPAKLKKDELKIIHSIGYSNWAKKYENRFNILMRRLKYYMKGNFIR